jgi:hypothetical protein
MRLQVFGAFCCNQTYLDFVTFEFYIILYQAKILNFICCRLNILTQAVMLMTYIWEVFDLNLSQYTNYPD